MWHGFFSIFVALFSFLHPAPYSKGIDKAQGSIVRIVGIADEDGERGWYVCTGFVYAPDRVMTAAHCLGQMMQADGRAVDEILKFDKTEDLAVLKVKTSKPPLAFRIAQVDRFEVITPIGYAFGANIMYADPHRVVQVDFSPSEDMVPGVLSSPNCIPGQSGGPQVDANVEVVAVTQVTAEGTCFGVGSLIIRAFLVGVN